MTAALVPYSVASDAEFLSPAIVLKDRVPAAFSPDVQITQPLDEFDHWGWRLGKIDPTPPSSTGTLTEFVSFVVQSYGTLSIRSDNGPKDGQADLHAFRMRIETLRADAAQDGYSIRRDSEDDFWLFVLSEPDIRRCNLVLTDNGNLRAVWKDGRGAHVGLQFLGGETVQFVIFKCRSSARQISRVAGRDSLEGVKRQIQVFDLQPLLYA